ncbi:MAG: hypothetical protein M3457_12890, partial [Chloroflexota bacterium]|nr:hypothetical protein [Chloroflexota bacterium]
AWGPISQAYRHGYSAVHVLLSDRAESRSEPLATVTTLVIGFESPEAAAEAGPALLDIAGYEPTEDVDGVTVYADVDGLLGLRTEGDYLVLVQYAFVEQQNSTRQNTEDWTPESIADLVDLTSDQLRDAVDQADTETKSLGVANVMFYGMQSPWTLPWIYYPSTEHYRVLDGEAVAYGGELDADLEDAIPEGAEDLFVSRQQIGNEGYEHLIDVTLARFGSEAQATTFASNPDGIIFPPTWIFNPDYTAADALPDGGMAERVQVDDNLRASGYRTIRQEGTTVQVVQWLASGNAVVSPEAIAWLTEVQSSCLDALPEPCAPIFQDEIPVALSEDYIPDPAIGENEATPASGTSQSNVVASDQFGWEVAVPDDGWELTDTETFTNSDYYEFESGRSLITIESVVDHHGDPQQCVLDSLALLETLEERAVIDIGSDDPDERAAGLEPVHGWAVYTVEPLQEQRTDEEYTIRYDCYTLAPGDASLVVAHTAPRDLWARERDKGERFRDGIRLPSPSANSHSTPLEGDGRFLGRTRTMGIPRIWIPRAA